MIFSVHGHQVSVIAFPILFQSRRKFKGTYVDYDLLFMAKVFLF